MAYPLSPALTAARARLQSGERLTARDVWSEDPRICRSAAHVTLTRWHAQRLTHIAEWRRYSSNGMPASWPCQLAVRTMRLTCAVSPGR